MGETAREAGVADDDDERPLGQYAKRVECGKVYLDSGDGRLTLPRRVVDTHGLKKGDVVDLVITLPTGDPLVVADTPMRDRRRITVPLWKRERHGIREDADVDVVLYIPEHPERR